MASSSDCEDDRLHSMVSVCGNQRKCILASGVKGKHGNKTLRCTEYNKSDENCKAILSPLFSFVLFGREDIDLCRNHYANFRLRLYHAFPGIATSLESVCSVKKSTVRMWHIRRTTYETHRDSVDAFVQRLQQKLPQQPVRISKATRELKSFRGDFFVLNGVSETDIPGYMDFDDPADVHVARLFFLFDFTEVRKSKIKLESGSEEPQSNGVSSDLASVFSESSFSFESIKQHQISFLEYVKAMREASEAAGLPPINFAESSKSCFRILDEVLTARPDLNPYRVIEDVPFPQTNIRSVCVKTPPKLRVDCWFGLERRGLDLFVTSECPKNSTICRSVGGLLVEAAVTSDTLAPITEAEAKHVLWVALAKLRDSDFCTREDLDLYLVPNRCISYWSLSSEEGRRKLVFLPKGRTDSPSTVAKGHPLAYLSESSSSSYNFRLGLFEDAVGLLATEDVSSGTKVVCSAGGESVVFTAEEVNSINTVCYYYYFWASCTLWRLRAAYCTESFFLRNRLSLLLLLQSRYFYISSRCLFGGCNDAEWNTRLPSRPQHFDQQKHESRSARTAATAATAAAKKSFTVKKASPISQSVYIARAITQAFETKHQIDGNKCGGTSKHIDQG
jgi:hypothetical protein